jgi:hypothetical protein
MLDGRSMGQYFDDLEAALLRQMGPPSISIGEANYFRSTFPSAELETLVHGSRQEIQKLSETVKEGALKHTQTIVELIGSLESDAYYQSHLSIRD